MQKKNKLKIKMNFIMIVIVLSSATLINGATNVVDVRIIDLKLRLNEFCTASNNRADASFYGLLKTLNTTNFAFGRLLRDVSNILNATTNHFNKTAVLNETVRSDFLNMMDLTFNQCIVMNTDVIEKFALPTFYAGSYAPNPALLPIQILCDKARKALVSLEKGLIENPTCSTPYLATLVPAMYPIPEKIVAIGNNAIVSIAREFAETGVAVRDINAYLIAVNLQIYHCQIAVIPTSNECMAKYINSQFCCESCKPLSQCNYPSYNHTTDTGEITEPYLTQLQDVKNQAASLIIFDQINECTDSL